MSTTQQTATGGDGSTADRAQAAAGTAQDEGKHLAATAQDQAQQVAGEATQQAKRLADEARGQVEDQSRQQRDRLVDMLRQASEELRSMSTQGSGVAAQLTGEIGDRAHQVAQHLDGREPGEILDDVRGFARRRPGLFLAGALAAGVVAGRLARGVKDAPSSGDHLSGGSGLPHAAMPPAPPAIPTQPTAGHTGQTTGVTTGTLGDGFDESLPGGDPLLPPSVEPTVGGTRPGMGGV